MHVVGFDFTSEKLAGPFRRSAHPGQGRVMGEGIAQNVADQNPVLWVGLANCALAGCVAVQS